MTKRSIGQATEYTGYGPRRPRLVVIETTLRCHHACNFCGSRGGQRLGIELSTDEIRSIVKQLAALGTESIDLSGGETYLRKDWLELIAAVSEAGIECTLITGGRGMTPERARAARAAGLTRAAVSIDGLEATHDRLRGVAGSFRQALSAMAALREVGVEIGCNTQVCAKNQRELFELGDVLSQQNLYGWQLQLMIPMGRAADAPDLWLQPFDLLEVIPAIAGVIEHFGKFGLRVHAGDNVGYFGRYETLLRRHTRDRHCLGCGAGAVALGIGPTGDVKGCSELDGSLFRAGDARKDAIADLWQRSPALHFNLEGQRIELWGYCAGCYYASVCRGGCPATATAVLGRPGNNPYCYHRAFEHAQQGARERLISVGTSDNGLRGHALCELRLESRP